MKHIAFYECNCLFKMSKTIKKESSKRHLVTKLLRTRKINLESQISDGVALELTMLIR